MKQFVASFLLASTLTACAHMGTKFEMADVDSLRPGVTTQQEAIAKLGKPNHSSTASNGYTLLAWQYAEAGYLTGATGRGVTLLFDKDGKMVRVMSRSELGS